MSATEPIHRPYEPLGVPKPMGRDLWIVDGPEIRMSYVMGSIPFPTRMTVVRLADGGLWVHSPIAPDAAVFDAIDALGPVRYLVAPNSIHYWYVADWQEHYPDARSFAVADLEQKAKRSFTIDDHLEDGPGPWGDELGQVVVPGTSVTEAVFFHRASRTTILVDLIENFEPERVRSVSLRWLMRMAGASYPHGKAPLDLRLTFWPRRREVRSAVRQILAWDTERVVMAHGKPIAEDGRAELERALSWAT